MTQYNATKHDSLIYKRYCGVIGCFHALGVVDAHRLLCEIINNYLLGIVDTVQLPFQSFIASECFWRLKARPIVLLL